jgi:hypothetical protein
VKRNVCSHWWFGGEEMMTRIVLLASAVSALVLAHG